MSYRFRAFLAFVAMAMFGSLLNPATPAQASHTDTLIKVVDANVGSGPTDSVRDEVNAMGAKIVTMQEICRSEFDRWKTDYGWKGEFSVQTQSNENGFNRCDGQDKGLAVLHHPMYSLQNVNVLPLPTASGVFNGDPWVSGKDFNLLCLDIGGTGIGHDLHVCTTHLWSGDDRLPKDQNDDVRTRQVNKAMDWLGPWQEWDRRVVFTGDLNAKPDDPTLNPIFNNYNEASGGRFAGADTTTDGRKIDYIFGDKPVLTDGLSVFGNPQGDAHKILRGRLIF